MNVSATWPKHLARAGYASRGVVYLIIGAFALLSAVGTSDKKGSKEALVVLIEQPFGRVLVVLLIGGLIGYVLWRLVQALLDTDDHGHSPKGLAVRAGLLSSAATYAILTIYALSLFGVLAGSDSGGPSVADRIAGYVGLKPVLLAMCAVFAGTGIAHWYKAGTQRYADHFAAPPRIMAYIHPISMAGLFARGMVFMVIAALLAMRLFRDSSGSGEPPGVQDALSFLHRQPYGDWLLSAMGVGLMLFAGYSFLEAIWRRINLEDAG